MSTLSAVKPRNHHDYSFTRARAQKAAEFLPLIIENSCYIYQVLEKTPWAFQWLHEEEDIADKKMIKEAASKFALKGPNIYPKEYIRRLRLDGNISASILISGSFLYVRMLCRLGESFSELEKCKIKLFAACVSISIKKFGENLNHETVAEILGFKPGKLQKMQVFLLEKLLDYNTEFEMKDFGEFCIWLLKLPHSLKVLKNQDNLKF